MNLFVYIQITDTPEEVKFYNPIISLLKEQQADFVVYDLDNHSDSLLLNYLHNLMTDAERIILLIEALPNGKFKNLMTLFTNLLDNPDRTKVILQGNNLQLEKMLSILTYTKITENTPSDQLILSIIKQFS
jgi:predicted rRNA methylase YqxC with S4 and FtsJ domains